MGARIVGSPARIGSQLSGLRGDDGKICEWLDPAGEYGLAYEFLVSLLESFDLKLSGNDVIKLLEVGLYFGFKFEGEESLSKV